MDFMQSNRNTINQVKWSPEQLVEFCSLKTISCTQANQSTIQGGHCAISHLSKGDRHTVLPKILAWRVNQQKRMRGRSGLLGESQGRGGPPLTDLGRAVGVALQGVAQLVGVDEQGDGRVLPLHRPAPSARDAAIGRPHQLQRTHVLKSLKKNNKTNGSQHSATKNNLLISHCKQNTRTADRLAFQDISDSLHSEVCFFCWTFPNIKRNQESRHNKLKRNWIHPDLQNNSFVEQLGSGSTMTEHFVLWNKTRTSEPNFGVRQRRCFCAHILILESSSWLDTTNEYCSTSSSVEGSQSNGFAGLTNREKPFRSWRVPGLSLLNGASLWWDRAPKWKPLQNKNTRKRFWSCTQHEGASRTLVIMSKQRRKNIAAPHYSVKPWRNENLHFWESLDGVRHICSEFASMRQEERKETRLVWAIIEPKTCFKNLNFASVALTM